MNKWFNPTLYDRCNYLSMLGFKLFHVSKLGSSVSLLSKNHIPQSCQIFTWSVDYDYVITSTYPICPGMYVQLARDRSYKHDDIIKWKHFPCNWPFVKGIHGSLVYSPHHGPWHGVLMFSLTYARTNIWANNWDDWDLKCITLVMSL